MFNEKGDRWIKIYKVVAIILCCLWAGFGVIAGIGDATAAFLDIGLGGDDDFLLDFLVWASIGGGIGFSQLVVNMLIIQLLNNVQIIRNKIEKM